MSAGERPRVLVLGGGFGGLGAVKKLEDADADVVLIDAHDYHTFQPLLYQLATGLLEPSAVGHALRDLVHGQENATVHMTSVTAIDLEEREVQFAEMAPLTYDYLVLALGAEVNFFGTEGAAEHAFPMYTLSDAVRLKDHLLERWEAADKDPSLVDDGALNVVVVGGGPTGVESAGAIAELYRSDFAKDYPEHPAGEGPRDPRRGRADGVRDVQAQPPGLRREGAAGADRRGRHRRAGRLGRADPRDAEVRRRRSRRTPSSGAPASRATSSSSRSGSTSSAATASASDRISPSPAIPRCTPSATSPRSRTRRRGRSCRSSAPSRSSRASTSARRSPGGSRGKEPKPFKYRDKGTMATIGRRAAVVQMLGGRTMKGTKAQLAWGTVHLALLPTNEDRAKAIVDWAGSAFTHQRTGRITVETDADAGRGTT